MPLNLVFFCGSLIWDGLLCEVDHGIRATESCNMDEFQVISVTVVLNIQIPLENVGFCNHILAESVITCIGHYPLCYHTILWSIFLMGSARNTAPIGGCPDIKIRAVLFQLFPKMVNPLLWMPDYFEGHWNILIEKLLSVKGQEVHLVKLTMGILLMFTQSSRQCHCAPKCNIIGWSSVCNATEFVLKV